ncbi:MAG: VOC family protein [Devosia sp.]
MTFYNGRLIDHVHLRARDLAASRAFYGAILDVLGIEIAFSGDNWFQVDELFVDAADTQTTPTHVHLAFQARDRAMIEAVYAAALAAGGIDNGAPGERAYHPGYYAAFMLDPDGNNIEAVFHGPSSRSAAVIEIEAL